MQPTPIPWMTAAAALGAALTLGGCVVLLDYDDYEDATAGAGGEGGASEPCTPGTTDACYSGDPGTENVGVCVGGTRTCRPDGLGYGECAGEVIPAAEVALNLADEDCDTLAGAEPRWGQRFGDSDPQGLGGLATGGDEIVIAGWFTGLLTLGGGHELVRPTSSGPDLFVAKLSPEGQPLWVVGGGAGTSPQRAQGVAADVLGDLFVTGYREAVSGPSASPEVGFLQRLNPNGSAGGAQTLFGSGSGSDHARGQAVAVNAVDQAFVAGRYQGSIVIGAETHQSSPADQSNVLVAQYMGAVTPGWSRSFGGTAGSEALGVVIDGAGDVLVTGHYREIMDFDQAVDPLVDDLADADEKSDAFVMKLGADGALLWARGLVDGTNESNAAGRAIGVDLRDGSVIVAGAASGTTEFAGDGSAPRPSGGALNAFAAKYDAQGSFLWAKVFRAVGVHQATGLSVDGEGSVFVSGVFSGDIDFDPDAPGGELTSAGAQDLFLAKLSEQGAHLWSGRFARVGAIAPEADPRLIRVAAPAGEAILAGSWDSELDFGAAGGPLPPGGNLDVFVARFGR